MSGIRFLTDGSYCRGVASGSNLIAAFIFALASASCSSTAGWYPLPIDDHKYELIDFDDNLKKSAVPRFFLGPKLELEWSSLSYSAISAKEDFDPLVKQLQPHLVELLSEHGIEGVKTDNASGGRDLLRLEVVAERNGEVLLRLELYRTAFPVWYPEDSLMVKVWWDQLSLAPSGSIDIPYAQRQLLQRVASLLSRKDGVGTSRRKTKPEEEGAFQRIRRGTFLPSSPFTAYRHAGTPLEVGPIFDRQFSFERVRRFCIQRPYGPVTVANTNLVFLIDTDLELLFRSYGEYPDCADLDQRPNSKRDAWVELDVGTSSGSTPGARSVYAKAEVWRTVRLTRVPLNIAVVVWRFTQERDISSVTDAEAERILRQVSMDATRQLLRKYLRAQQARR